MMRLNCLGNHGKCFYRHKISTHYGNVRAHVNLGGNACSASQTILTLVHHCLPAESSRTLPRAGTIYERVIQSVSVLSAG